MWLWHTHVCQCSCFSCHDSDESTKLVFSQHHMKDGLFLLRESRSRDATYILSLCHEGDVKHYKIRRDISRGFCLEDQNEQTPSSSEKGFHQTLHVLISNHNHVKVSTSGARSVLVYGHTHPLHVHMCLYDLLFFISYLLSISLSRVFYILHACRSDHSLT